MRLWYYSFIEVHPEETSELNLTLRETYSYIKMLENVNLSNYSLLDFTKFVYSCTEGVPLEIYFICEMLALRKIGKTLSEHADMFMTHRYAMFEREFKAFIDKTQPNINMLYDAIYKIRLGVPCLFREYEAFYKRIVRPIYD